MKLHFLEHFHLCFRDQVKSLSYMILSQSLAEVTTILQYVVENFSFYSISVYKNCCHENNCIACAIKFDKESRESSVVNDVH